MIKGLHKLAVATLALALALAGAAYADDKKGKDPKAKDAKGDEEKEYLVAPEEVTVRKVYTASDRKRICAKYEKQLIAYYGDVWKVDDCRRRPITDSKTVYGFQRNGQKVVDVDADVIAALREGEPLDLNEAEDTIRGCKVLESHYVTFSAVDVYFVEHCKRRLFPDWATYVKHRDRRGDKKGEILSLSLIEFDRLPPGEPLPSVVDDLFSKLLTGSAGVEIIPIDEACDGLEGKVASYYSRLYRVERCRKREVVEPDLYVKRNGGINGLKATEMKSEQWLSLPDGEPIGAPLAPVPGKKTARK